MELSGEVKRIQSIDLLRGIVIALMVLDHTRDFFHVDAFKFAPENLSQTNYFLFFTRWVTHFCAPVFAFLAGVSITLFAINKTKDKNSLFKYLITRGLILILLEITLIRFGWRFRIDYSSLGGLVIWALGWSMIFLAFLSYLPRKVIGVLGILIIAFHNILDSVGTFENTTGNLLWSFLHVHKYVKLTESFGINILYPVLPVLGLMMAGFYLGEIFTSDTSSKKRKQFLLYSGILTTFLFIILRGLNLYGDPSPWIVPENPAFTILSFLNTSKYPFSLLYTLMTMGPALIFLGLIEGKSFSVHNPFMVFGKEPLVFYIIHLYVIHGLAIVMAVVFHFNQLNDIISGQWNKLAEGYGFNIGIVYLIAAFVLYILYFICRKVMEIRRTKEYKLLNFL